ncbi:MAG TPA: hypothetical protein P5164_12315, partial [Thermoanaerobaculia bacterium]|nr:hypothetical protein [Thermoanaerobaculia bacterium]
MDLPVGGALPEGALEDGRQLGPEEPGGTQDPGVRREIVYYGTGLLSEDVKLSRNPPETTGNRR